MTLDPNTPVIVGVAQLVQRPDDLNEAVEAAALMERVLRDAASDTGRPALLARLDYVGVVQGAWRYSDPGRLLADAVGAASAVTGLSANGGNAPQSYINALASRIAAGQLGCAAVVGGETIWSRRRRRRAGIETKTTEQEGVEPGERFGDDVPMTTELERSRGMELPVNFYPLFDSAIRAARGETIEEHRDRLAALWARFNQVAVANEHAWVRTPMTAGEIRDPSPSNRMVGFPYTKAMSSNWDLDQAAAVLLCSAAVAEAAGVERDRWVFPLAGADAHDTYAVSERRDLCSSPAIAAAGRRVYELTGSGADDVAHIDLYSCFPSAVQVGAEALGFGEERQLTQTGGLTFAGGPLNNYVTHSIATMVDVLRRDPGSIGLVSANGGFLTKHAIGLYSTEPGGAPFLADDVQDEVDHVPRTEVDESYTGPVTVEAYTVMHDHDGPAVGLCALRTGANRRTWGRVADRGVLGDMTGTEHIGTEGVLDSDGSLSFA
jgi:acetyl-CoA C-acetyltransferase